LTIAGHTFAVEQTGSVIDLGGAWSNVVQACKGTAPDVRCQLKGRWPSKTLAAALSRV